MAFFREDGKVGQDMDRIDIKTDTVTWQCKYCGALNLRVKPGKPCRRCKEHKAS